MSNVIITLISLLLVARAYGQEEMYLISNSPNQGLLLSQNAAPSYNILAAQDTCTLGQTPYTVPLNFVQSSPDDFIFMESGLQIFTDMRVPCSGVITEWHFVARNRLVVGLHLGIFRGIPNDTTLYRLVGETAIDLIFTNDVNSWMSYKLNSSLPVSRGDVIGMFYDRFATVSDLLAIPSRGNRNNYQNGQPDGTTPPSIVLVMDNTSLQRNKTFSVAKAYRDNRIPALVAIVQPSQVTTTTPPASTIAQNRLFLAPALETEPPFQIITTTTPRPTRRRRPTTTTPFPPTTVTTTTTTTTTVTTTVAETRRRRTTTVSSTQILSRTSPAGLPPYVLPQEQMSPVRQSARVIADQQPLFATNRPAMPPVTDSPSFATPINRAIFSRRCLNPPTALQQCDSLALRAFFDYEHGNCKPFFGCGTPAADPNNFDTAEECNSLCGGLAATAGIISTTTPSNSRVVQRSIMNCYDTPSALVACNDVGPRYYYDSSTMHCYSFYGCSLGDHRGNNFNTLEECQAVCQAAPSLLVQQGSTVSTAAPQPTPSPRAQFANNVPQIFLPGLMSRQQGNNIFADQPSNNNNNNNPYYVPSNPANNLNAVILPNPVLSSVSGNNNKNNNNGGNPGDIIGLPQPVLADNSRGSSNSNSNSDYSPGFLAPGMPKPVFSL